MINIVITGGPGCGKSTLLLELGRRGFQVMPESFRWMRMMEFIEGGPDPLRKRVSDAEFFLHLGLQRFLQDEDCGEDGLCFFDRSLIDIVAYCRAFGMQEGHSLLVPHAIETARRIRVAFLLEAPEETASDWMRSVNPEESARLHTFIETAYHEFGIRVIHMRRTEVSTLVDQLLRAIPEFGA